ncbi:MAG: organomercurial lyase [bacterium]
MSTATFNVHAMLSTWCAWDSLLLPALLNQTAEVESACPQTGDPIRLTIWPEYVQKWEPQEAVVSFVLPEPREQIMQSPGQVWKALCHHVFFFSSEVAALTWFSNRRSHRFVILSIEEGYRLTRLVFARMLDYAGKLIEIRKL